VRALILGGGGQLASDLETRLGAQARSYGHAELDICDEAAVSDAYAETAPDVVYNCAAFHNVEVCESEPEQAWRVNVEAVRRLAQRGVPLVHVSTNYVFDGRDAEPYSEDDRPNPRSVYALSKLAGEYAALAYGTRALVVRTAGLYGTHGSASKGGNFVQRMVARAREDGPRPAQLKMVSDQRLQPTFTADLADAILAAVAGNAEGVVHLTAEGACSWFEFTEEIVRIAGLDATLDPVTTTIPPGGADRPLNGVLARDRADALGLPALRHWRDGLTDYMDQAGLAAPTTEGT
jgi:dTDP-4-dehydrorhamnose reductase